MARNTTPTKTPDRPRGLVVRDVPHAPIVYFEGAPTFGCNNGIVNVTLAASRNLLDGTAVVHDVVAVASLRCNVQAAIALRDALNDALLIGAPSEGGTAN